MILHMMLYLAKKFSISVQRAMGFTITTLPHATHVLVTPQMGSGDIVPILQYSEDVRISVAGHEVFLPKHFCTFQKITYHINPTTSPSCSPQAYPENYSAESYVDWRGYSSSVASVAGEVWGTNDFDIPLPAYVELLLVCC